MCDVVSARCCRLASKLQQDCYLSASMGLTTAWSRPSDLLLECCEWLASVQTDELARSSLLLLLLHSLAGLGKALHVNLVRIVAVDVDLQ